jgi:RNA polymerase sigma factor (sigma-70 family)
VRDDPVVVALVARAAAGDRSAWNEIVERYGPLVWSICNRYGLTSHDIEDVGQTVWLRLVEQLGNLREPAALPGWLATTTQRECQRVLRATRRSDQFEPVTDQLPLDSGPSVIEQEIIIAETNAALRAAFAELPLRCRQLLTMLISDPPQRYTEISRILQVPIGSIGPERARCLQRLRKSASLAGLIDTEVEGPRMAGSGGVRDG